MTLMHLFQIFLKGIEHSPDHSVVLITYLRSEIATGTFKNGVVLPASTSASIRTPLGHLAISVRSYNETCRYGNRKTNPV